MMIIIDKIIIIIVQASIAGETGGGDRGGDLPLRAPLIPYPGRDPGDRIHNKMGPFYFFLTVFQQMQ